MARAIGEPAPRDPGARPRQAERGRRRPRAGARLPLRAAVRAPARPRRSGRGGGRAGARRARHARGRRLLQRHRGAARRAGARAVPGRLQQRRLAVGLGAARSALEHPGCADLGRTGSHRRSLQLLEVGEIDAAPIDSYVLRLERLARRAYCAFELRRRVGPMPAPPVVVFGGDLALQPGGAGARCSTCRGRLRAAARCASAPCCATRRSRRRRMSRYGRLIGLRLRLRLSHRRADRRGPDTATGATAAASSTRRRRSGGSSPPATSPFGWTSSQMPVAASGTPSASRISELIARCGFCASTSRRMCFQPSRATLYGDQQQRQHRRAGVHPDVQRRRPIAAQVERVDRDAGAERHEQRRQREQSELRRASRDRPPALGAQRVALARTTRSPRRRRVLRRLVGGPQPEPGQEPERQQRSACRCGRMRSGSPVTAHGPRLAHGVTCVGQEVDAACRG